MDGAGSHYPEQTNKGKENQTLHVLTYKWELNDKTYGHMAGGTTHTGWGLSEGWRVRGGREAEKKTNGY